MILAVWGDKLKLVMDYGVDHGKDQVARSPATYDPLPVTRLLPS